jgi:hypothetical protein
MKKLVFLLAVAAAVGFFLRRNEASELWDSARDTVSSWKEPAATKAKEVAETAVQAADSATSAARNAADKAKDVAE